MKALLLGFVDYDFPGEDGRQVKGTSVHLAVPSTSRDFKGMQGMKFSLGETANLPSVKELPARVNVDILKNRILEITAV